MATTSINGNCEQHMLLLYDLIQRIQNAKVAFNVPVGRSNRTDDRDYLEEVGRMTLEVLNDGYERLEI